MMNKKIFILLSFSAFSALGECSDFNDWKTKYRESLQNRGVSETIIKTTIDQAQFQEKIIQNDRAQSEFIYSLYGYLDRMYSPKRVENAHLQYKELKAELDILEQKYGIGGEYLIAFWGMETNFGTYQGNIRTIDALATLSCDQRRSQFFTKELDIFIDLVEQNYIAADAQSSWAGAMGHLQFLPNKIQKYRVDGDGDDNVDIFTSRKDAFETAARYLNGEGWRANEPWGQEVILPAKFNYDFRGRDKKRTIAEWINLGVIPVDNRPFLLGDDKKAAIIAPQGADGPAFITYSNFDVIMIWNHSTSYALTIGLLADNISDDIEIFHQREKDWQEVDKKQIIATQKALKNMGFYTGLIDGDWGYQSRLALKRWQIENNFPNDGYLSHNLYVKIQSMNK